MFCTKKKGKEKQKSKIKGAANLLNHDYYQDNYINSQIIELILFILFLIINFLFINK